MSKEDMLKEGQKALKDPKKALDGGKSKLADFLDDGKINNSNAAGKTLGEVAKDRITGLAGGEETKDADGNVIKKKGKGGFVKEGLEKLADYLDDGKLNKSTKGKDSAAVVG